MVISVCLSGSVKVEFIEYSLHFVNYFPQIFAEWFSKQNYVIPLAIFPRIPHISLSDFKI